MRFWGKIFGQEADYYVAEGDSAPEADKEPEEMPVNVEKRGEEGINKKIYWVTTNLTKDWIELPTVTPEQLVTSRNLKYLFTGNLDSQICRNPHFVGTEANLVQTALHSSNARF